ncbi:unnamed protein product, partial [Mesorhabditis belari]|uniref:Trs120/TRAPPC9 N-terminal domain-containing protein n=1 Tax=Mesorhabditis belari TaxID=2138241 RepID=A0AAF3F114_9BILA
MSPIQIVDKILLLLFLFHINHVIGQEKFDSIPITSISIPIKITGPINVTLPRESVELTIDFENDPNDSFENVSLSFQWEVIAGTGLATAKAYNRRKLTLVQLKSGVIVVRATVTGKDFNGRAEHTLELIEPPEASRPPQAVIRPEGPIESVEGNTLTLDAEGSLVSATPASFEWVQVSGPTVALSATNTPSLKIERLAQGVYKFRVTVSDTEGRSDSTTVTVNVKEERDDPPKAHITECGTGTATGMVSVRLPLNHIHLCANSSQDDKGIVEYRWYRVDSFTHELTVDIDGSSSNVLELRNLQATEQLGAYEFALDVVDGKHQKDSTKVSVFVHAAHNLPPEPNGGGNRTVILPESSLVLEGNAKDDGVIKAFNWTQISGPSTISIVNANQAKATISKLILGDYIFQFSVTDDGGLEAHDIVKVSVIRGENKPPIALAENVTVSLPISVVKLDGSASHDDAGIVAYRWTPDDDTPAILELLDGSQNTPVLLVGGLVEGIFKFNFSVRDQQEEKDEKWVWLHVEKGEAERESVELLIRQSVERFSYLQKSKLENRIAAILSSGVSGVSQVLIHTTRLEEYHSSGGDFRMLFWAEAIDQTDGLEEAIREFVRNIYFVHEQKRMDVAFEKVDPPPCPLLPEEEKLRVGTENKTSKTFRRKCIGRCRKHQADYTLLAGLPSQALEHYQNAIELLKSANDFLWLAGALEGWACAAMALIFEEMNTNRSSMHRVATLTPAQLREAAQGKNYHSLGFQHSLALINSSDKLGICDVRVQITQPKVNGGPSLIKLANEFDTTNDSLCTPTLESEGFTLAPGEQKPIEFTMFGVDPTATTDDEKSQSLDETRMSDFRPPSPTPSIVSEMSSATFIGDRIPYTGRLLTAQFVFDYTATLEGPSGEHYKRTARLPIAITVVPAITVAAWSILPGDGPFTRYIVVDVSNSTDSDADLVFSGTRAMSVPPRETCRVPLLCPCCTEVAGRAFYAAQQKDSKVMQRLEIERLRRILEAHVAKHLDIRWTISTKNLEGLVPVGALLSSIPLLKQLVLPAISLELIVNGVPYLSQDDLSVGIGDVNVLEIAVISSLDYEFHGEMELECEQEVLLRRKSIPRPHNLVIVGSRKVPFSVPTKGGDDSLLTPKSKIVFRLLFRVEGVYKVRPIVRARREEQQLFADEKSDSLSLLIKCRVVVRCFCIS